MNTTGELNLYLDLLAFSELSPEELLADRERLKDASSNQILEVASEFPGFVVEATDSIVNDSIVIDSIEIDSVDNASIEEVISSNETSEPFALLEPTVTSEPVLEFPPAEAEVAAVEPACADLPSETTELPAATVDVKDIFRASGPLSLSGLLFDPTLKAAPLVMTLAVCATCGSETDGEDLFCVACGSFLDESAEPDTPGLACDECGLIVTTGDLICPSCGSMSLVCW